MRNSPLLQHLRKEMRKFTHKRVNIEVLSQDGKRVIQRYRFNPPNGADGRKHRFTDKGEDQVLENFIASFERDNPNHRYRLVVCKDKFRLVWTPEEEEDTQKKELEQLVKDAQAITTASLGA